MGEKLGKGGESMGWITEFEYVGSFFMKFKLKLTCSIALFWSLGIDKVGVIAFASGFWVLFPFGV